MINVVVLEMQVEMFTLKKSINVISHTNTLKKEILRNISTDTEKAFIKLLYLFMT